MWVGATVTRVLNDATIQEGMVYMVTQTDDAEDEKFYPAHMTLPDRYNQYSSKHTLPCDFQQEVDGNEGAR
jgi:hypothetical protein